MNGGRDPESGTARWWDDSLAESDDPVVGAVALLVLGAGLGSLFGVPLLNAVEFWVIFAVGYTVVVPLVSLFRGRTDRSRRDRRKAEDTETDDTDAALDRLRDRYARGELSEAHGDPTGDGDAGGRPEAARPADGAGRRRRRTETGVRAERVTAPGSTPAERESFLLPARLPCVDGRAPLDR